MSLVKIYKYKIKPNCESTYLEFQEKVQKIYREYGEIDFTYLKDENDFLKRTEIIRFFGDNPKDVIVKVDSDKRILELFKQFSAEVLDVGVQITEDVLLDAQYVGQKPDAIANYPYKFKNNILSPVLAEHAPILFPQIHKTKVTDTILWDGPENLESYISGFKLRQKQVMNNKIYMFTIFSNGEPCGSCSIRPQDDEFKADIGLWISENASGKGLGTKVVQELTEFGFNYLKLQRIEAYVFEGNLASRKIFENNSYIFEGTLRQGCKKRGQFLNEWLLAITKDDYIKINN